MHGNAEADLPAKQGSQFTVNLPFLLFLKSDFFFLILLRADGPWALLTETG